MLPTYHPTGAARLAPTTERQRQRCRLLPPTPTPTPTPTLALTPTLTLALPLAPNQVPAALSPRPSKSCAARRAVT